MTSVFKKHFQLWFGVDDVANFPYLGNTSSIRDLLCWNYTSWTNAFKNFVNDCKLYKTHLAMTQD